MMRISFPSSGPQVSWILVAACAVAVFLSAAMTPQMAHAADEAGGPFYFPIDDVAVQYEHKQCKRITLSLALEIEYTQGDKTSQINSYIPKVKSVIFAALDDHLAKEKKAKRGKIQRVVKKAVQSVLGKKLVSDVLITRLMQMK